MRKTFTTVTFRVDTQTAKTLKTLRHGTRAMVLRELIENNPKTIQRYTTKKAA